MKTTSEWNQFLDGEKIEYHKNGKVKKKESFQKIKDEIQEKIENKKTKKL